MNDEEISEIIDYINSKYKERIPSVARTLIRRKLKKIKNYSVDELPDSLRSCTVEQLLEIVKKGLKKGTLKL